MKVIEVIKSVLASRVMKHLLLALFATIFMFQTLQSRYHFQLLDGLVIFTMILYNLSSLLINFFPSGNGE